jgi:hypothetical protein
MNINLDYEHEYNSDYIYALERERDMYAAWQEQEHLESLKPKAIIEIIPFNEKHKSSTFRRTTKKILHSRSRLFANANK